MNLLETLLQAQGGGAVRQLAGQFGLDENQATSAISALLPALAGGLQKNVAQEGGLESLLGALTQGNHQRFLDDPSTLANESTVAEGNGILGHLLGSKDVSRQVAASAAEQTGIGPGILKQMLPVVATMVMGALSRHSSQQNLASQAAPAEGILGALSGLLDTNKDGSIADDVMGMVGKLFQK
ncbi:MAG: DUF937 domain-containing protein [Bryobacterales bacterium]|nr:DUF937 domain-containing protein [Bryobacterales bacterium]